MDGERGKRGIRSHLGLMAHRRPWVAWCHWGERERADKEDMGEGGEVREGSGEQRTIKIGKVSSESGDGILNSQSSRTASASSFN